MFPTNYYYGLHATNDSKVFLQFWLCIHVTNVGLFHGYTHYVVVLYNVYVHTDVKLF